MAHNAELLLRTRGREEFLLVFLSFLLYVIIFIVTYRLLSQNVTNGDQDPRTQHNSLSYLKWAHQLSPHFRNFFSNISKLFVISTTYPDFSLFIGTRKNSLLSCHFICSPCLYNCVEITLNNRMNGALLVESIKKEDVFEMREIKAEYYEYEDI